MKEKLKDFIKNCESRIKRLLIILFKKRSLEHLIRKGNYKDLPIYIISYNRLNYVKQTVEWLRGFGYKNITIIDNNSDYEPLLEYFKDCPCKVIRMKKNYGHKVFYNNIRFLFKRLNHYFFLTDPDLYPIENCPDDFAEVFIKQMYKNVDVSKVGFSLKIDDIPDDFYLKDEVLSWEEKYYKDYYHDDEFNVNCYKAGIDTTFALNSPMIFMPRLHFYEAIRVGEPYQLRHLPWYSIEDEKENEHYLKTKRNDISNWNGDVDKEEMQKNISENKLK